MICISYKSDYTNTCRGCVMEQYGSDFEIRHFLTEEELIDHCASLNARTHFEQVYGENRWDHYLIKEGFEKEMQPEDFDPELGDVAVSQGECSSVFQMPFDLQEKIKLRTDEIYNQLIAEQNAKKKAKEEKEKQFRLQQEIEKAKKLLKEHPEKF